MVTVTREHSGPTAAMPANASSYPPVSVRHPGARELPSALLERLRAELPGILLRTVADPAECDREVRRRIGALSADEIRQLLAWTEGLDPPPNRFILCNRLLERWLATDPAAAVAYACALAGAGVDETNARAVVQFLWDSDVSVAAEFAAGLSVKARRDELLTQSLQRWVAQDFAGATTWVRQLPDGESKKVALLDIMESWAERDPVGLVGFTFNLSLQDYREVIDRVTVILADQDPLTAALWVGSLPDGSARAWMEATVAGKWARRAPLAALSYASNLDGEGRDRATIAIASAAGNEVPEIVLEGLSGLSESAARDRAATRLLSVWGQRDPDAVATWLLAAPESSFTDKALANFALTVGAGSPEEAALWLELIADPFERERMIRVVRREFEGTER